MNLIQITNLIFTVEQRIKFDYEKEKFKNIFGALQQDFKNRKRLLKLLKSIFVLVLYNENAVSMI